MSSADASHPHHPPLWLFLEPEGALPSPREEAARLFGVPADTPWRLARRRGRDLILPAEDVPARASAEVARALRDLGPWALVRPREDLGVSGGITVAVETAVPQAAAQIPEMFGRLLDRLRALPAADADEERLVDAALQVRARPGFETLISLGRLRFEPFPHQLQTAATVLRRMRGRAILADEVGLGKTIEAGLVLSELFLRRLATRVLILVPAGLVGQWGEELERKFGLPFVVHGGRGWERQDPWHAGIVLASLPAVRRSPHREAAAAVDWDLVVVDEAHRLKNPRSASAQLVRSLRARYLLLLTATPVENRLDDLFHLVNLVRPGHLGNMPEFRRLAEAEAARGLQGRMREIMVRHRRSEVALMLPRRLAETVRVEPAPEEADLYAAVSAEVRRRARGAPPAEAMALRTLQRLAGSSPAALAAGLAQAGWHDLAARAEALPVPRKARVLLERLGRHFARGEKVLVFSGFRRTVEYLADLLASGGIPAVAYHGGLSRQAKDAAVAAFAAEVPVLLATEAAGEGRNLQFCHVMINFDLPWNPMQIEQRLGRVHRIGQRHDVVVTNLVDRGTIEERILEVLEAKIHLFELVVGELDMILGRVEDDFDFEAYVFDAYVRSGEEPEFAARLGEVGDALARARAAYLEGRARNDELLPGEETA